MECEHAWGYCSDNGLTFTCGDCGLVERGGYCSCMNDQD